MVSSKHEKSSNKKLLDKKVEKHDDEEKGGEHHNDAYSYHHPNNDDNPSANAGTAANDNKRNCSSSRKSSSFSTRKNAASAAAAARRILHAELRREVQPLAWGCLAMLASSWTNQALPRLMGRLIDTQSSSSSSSSLSSRSGGGGGGVNSNNNNNMTTSLGLVILGGGLSSFVRTYLLAKVEASIAARLRTRAVESLLVHKDLQWFQNEQLIGGHNSSNNEGNNNDDEDDNDRGTSGSSKQDASSSSRSTSDNAAAAAAAGSDNGGKSAVAAAVAPGISPGAIAGVLDEDVNRLAGCLTKTLVNLLRYTSSIVFSTYRMLCLDAALLAISASVVPVIGATAIVLHKAVSRVTARQAACTRRAASFLEERIQHIAMVQMSHRQDDEVQAYTALQKEATRLARTAAWYQGGFMGFIFAASSGALLLVVHSGGRSVARGKMTSGQLATFATYSFLLGLGTSGVVKTMGEWTLTKVSAERYERLIMTNNDDIVSDDVSIGDPVDTNSSVAADESIVSPSSSCNLLCDVDVNAVETISLRNVCFSYQSSKSSAIVLNNISFALKRGQVVALVGRNGSGKSTLASILAGLYRPTSGEIHLVAAVAPSNNTAVADDDDGTILTDLCRVDKDCRKRLVQLIPQSTALFNTSILENVRYSNPNATIETVYRALNQAHCDDLLNKLQQQQQRQQQNTDNHDVDASSSSSSSLSVLDYVVGLNGCKLSGGERQRLALARALVSDPACLVMDEPASSMDSEGEAAIYHALEACRGGSGGGRALLLITHDAKILQQVDSIIVLNNGEIVERGTLEELVRSPHSHLLTLMPDLCQNMKRSTR